MRVQGRQAAGDSVNERRVALVIGNSAYTRIAALRNPGKDARDMAAALIKAGFRVTLLLNATRGQYGNVGTTNPVFTGSGGYRVLRGGGWNVISRNLRCSRRSNDDPSSRGVNLGFRLLRSK